MSDAHFTASSIVSYSEKLEAQSTLFYEKLAQRFEEQQDTFMRFAKECKKNKTHIVRTYQETISDALEATFSFDALVLPEFDFESLTSEATNFHQAIKGAATIESQAADFYTELAEQAQSLLATIPRAFSRVAKARRSRSEALLDLLE